MANNPTPFPDLPNIKVLESGKSSLFCNYVFKAIPLAFDESLSYYECLCGLLSYLKNTIIPTVNNNAEAVVELQNLYGELHDYVENYFDNLDVQEEINNKLDKMVEDGTLENILLNYTTIEKIYNTAVEMLADSDNLTDGMHIKTLGYYEINDDGAASYFVSDTPLAILVDESIYENASIPIHDNLYINYIKNGIVNIAQLGAEANTDITTLLQKAINLYRFVQIPKNSYVISSTIDIPAGATLFGIHRRNSILSFTGTGFAISVKYGAQIRDIGIDCTAGTYTQDNNIMGDISMNPCLVQTWTRANVSGVEFVASHSFADRVEVKNASLYGFRPDTYCELTNCLALNTKYAYAPSIDNMLSDCTAQYCEIGVYINNGYTNKLTNIRIDECTKHFVYINGGNSNVVDILGGQSHLSGVVVNASTRNRISGLISRCSQISRGKAWNDSYTALDDYAICETGLCNNNYYDITVQVGDSYLYNHTTHSYFPKRLVACENSYCRYNIMSPLPTANDTIVNNFGTAYDFDFSPYFKIDYARCVIFLNYLKLSFNGAGSNGYYINDMAYNQTNKSFGNYIRFNSNKIIFGLSGNEKQVTVDS